MEATHQESRPAPRQRVAHYPHVDIMHSAAAGQLVITAHVDMERGPLHARPVPPATLEAALAAAIQSVVDELMPFPEAAEPSGVAEQSFDASQAEDFASGPAAAIPSATEPGQVDQLAGHEVGAGAGQDAQS